VCEGMGSMYLGQDMSVSVRAVCIYVRIGVCGYRLPVSRSRYDCECIGWLYLGQDRNVNISAVCI
jgi:hypothetical protein